MPCMAIARDGWRIVIAIACRGAPSKVSMNSATRKATTYAGVALAS